MTRIKSIATRNKKNGLWLVIIARFRDLETKNSIKPTFTLIVLSLISFGLSAQNPLSVYAGHDTVLCANNFRAYDVAKHASVSGGVEPYTYRWSTPASSRTFVEVDLSQYDFPKAASWEWDFALRASHVIGDTSVLHTDIGRFAAIGNIYPAMPLILTVEDAAGTTVSDTMMITAGGYYKSTLNGKVVPFTGSLNLGDIVTYIVDDRNLGYLPLATSEWFPKRPEILSSPFDFEIDVTMTDINFNYSAFYQDVTDIAGCKMRFKPYDQMLYTLSSETLTDKGTQSPVNVYPNPSEETVIVEGLQPGQSITVFDMQGRIVRAVMAQGNRESINVDQAGIYMIRIGDEHAQWQKLEIAR